MLIYFLGASATMAARRGAITQQTPLRTPGSELALWPDAVLHEATGWRAVLPARPCNTARCHQMVPEGCGSSGRPGQGGAQARYSTIPATPAHVIISPPPATAPWPSHCLGYLFPRCWPWARPPWAPPSPLVCCWVSCGSPGNGRARSRALEPC